MQQQKQRPRGQRQSLAIMGPADVEVTRPELGRGGDPEAACILLGLGTSRSYNSRVHPEPRAGRGGQGQLGPGPWGAASVVEASRGCCLDPLTCLGPQHSSQSPQGEGRRTWSNANTDAHSTGRRSGARLRRRSPRRAPQGPAGPSDVSSHRARPRCPLLPSTLAGQTAGSKNTQSGLLVPLCSSLDLEGPPFSAPATLQISRRSTLGMSPERKSLSTRFQGPSLSSCSMMPGQMLTGCWMPENWSTLGSPQQGAHPPHPCSLPQARGLRAHPLRDLRVLPEGSREFKKMDKQKGDPTDRSLAKG